MHLVIWLPLGSIFPVKTKAGLQLKGCVSAIAHTKQEEAFSFCNGTEGEEGEWWRLRENKSEQTDIDLMVRAGVLSNVPRSLLPPGHQTVPNQHSFYQISSKACLFINTTRCCTYCCCCFTAIPQGNVWERESWILCISASSKIGSYDRSFRVTSTPTRDLDPAWKKISISTTHLQNYKWQNINEHNSVHPSSRGSNIICLFLPLVASQMYILDARHWHGNEISSIVTVKTGPLTNTPHVCRRWTFHLC